MASTQEIRNATIGAAVTPTEKRYAELFATVEGRPLSQLLWEYSIGEIVKRGETHARSLRNLSEREAA